MSEENENVVEAEETKPDNPYANAMKSDLRSEYDEKKKQYKAARSKASTVAERNVVMRLWQDDLIDMATETRIAKDWDLNTAQNQEIDALARRLSTGRRSW